MESTGTAVCPVCTLYLRPGITLHSHLETHPKDKVIEALVRQQYVLPATAVFNAQQVLCQPVVYHHQQQQQQQVIVAATTSSSSQQQQQQQQQAQIIPVIVSSSTVSSFLAASSSIAAAIQQNGPGEILPPNTQMLNPNSALITPNSQVLTPTNQPTLISSNSNPSILDSQLLSPNSLSQLPSPSSNQIQNQNSVNSQILTSTANSQVLAPMIDPTNSQLLSQNQILSPTHADILSPSSHQMLSHSNSLSQMMTSSNSATIDPSNEMLGVANSTTLISSNSTLLGQPTLISSNSTSNSSVFSSNSSIFNPPCSTPNSNAMNLISSNSTILTQPTLISSNSQMMTPSNSLMFVTSNHPTSSVLCSSDTSSKLITSNSTILNQPNLISSNQRALIPSNSSTLILDSSNSTNSSNTNSMIPSSNSLIMASSGSTNSDPPTLNTKPEPTILAQPPTFLQSSYSGYITATPTGAVFIYRSNEEVPEESYSEELNKSCQTSGNDEVDEIKRSDESENQSIEEEEQYSKEECADNEEIEETEMYSKVEFEENSIIKHCTDEDEQDYLTWSEEKKEEEEYLNDAQNDVKDETNKEENPVGTRSNRQIAGCKNQHLLASSSGNLNLTVIDLTSSSVRTDLENVDSSINDGKLKSPVHESPVFSSKVRRLSEDQEVNTKRKKSRRRRRFHEESDDEVEPEEDEIQNSTRVLRSGRNTASTFRLMQTNSKRHQGKTGNDNIASPSAVEIENSSRRGIEQELLQNEVDDELIFKNEDRSSEDIEEELTKRCSIVAREAMDCGENSLREEKNPSQEPSDLLQTMETSNDTLCNVNASDDNQSEDLLLNESQMQNRRFVSELLHVGDDMLQERNELLHNVSERNELQQIEASNIQISYLRSDEVIEYGSSVKDEPRYLTLTSAHQSTAQPAQARRRSDSRAVDMDGMNLMVNSECFTINEYAIGGEESVSVDGATIRADENMPARGELSGQESSNASDLVVALRSGCDLLARESWDEEEEDDGDDYEGLQNNFPITDEPGLSYSCFNHFKQDSVADTKAANFASSSQPMEAFTVTTINNKHDEKANFASTGFSSKKGKASTSAELPILVNKRVSLFETEKISTLNEPTDADPNANKRDIFVSAASSSLADQSIGNNKRIESTDIFSGESAEVFKSEKNNPSSSLHSKTVPAIGKVEVDGGFFGGNPIVCTLCSCVLDCAASLKQHSEEVHGLKGDEKYKCIVCNESFQTEPKFTQHLQVHPLECRLCGKYFYRRQNMQLHLKRHMNIRPYKCTSCEKSFLTKQKLDEHRNVHTGAAPIKCTLCDETFRRHSNLVQHRNRHHLDVKRKVKDFVCTCGEVFHSKKKLAWHRETHDGKPKACPMCSEKFVHAASLTRHMRKAHNEKFVPDAGRDKENVECTICKNVYLRSSLEVHMKTHTGARPFACSICNKDFTTKWNLKLHKWTHAARINKPYKCDRCKGAFVRASDYAAHMNAHKSVRPYTCNHCGAQFIRKYNCLRHVREHERTKTHACQICGKEFHRSYYLKDHMRVHSGARPYACHICGKTSATKSNHNKHVRIHHARDPVSTEN